MSAPELVTLTVDGIEVSVPKGTGLVEAALAAGIEIPVFCYEPRLGPPVGACRMCLCEVAPGPPKPQAACTLTVAEGMEVKTALTSEMAADAQNGTLEFILVNHPLDCPVCDKGGECPLQDLTFRYGPGNTRMAFPKRTFEKPIPISPTIALDRERCILCYRCTRFSESVAEDGQLVAINRGAHSMIATFEDEPYRAHVLRQRDRALPGRRAHLDAVPLRGAAVGDPERADRLRPLPGRLQHHARRRARARSSGSSRATTPRSTRAGSATRAASRSATSTRTTGSPTRCGKAGDGFETLSWGDGIDEAERLLRAAGSRIVTALSGNETVEQAYGLAKLLRVGLGAHAAVLPEAVPDGLDALRAPLSSIRDATRRRRPLRGAGRRARAGRRALDQGRAPQRRPRARPSSRTRRSRAACSSPTTPTARPGTRAKCGAAAAFYLPRTPNARGVADAWSAAADGEPDDVEPHAARSSPATRRRSTRASARSPSTREAVIGIGMFEGSFRGLCDLVLPGTSYLERDGTTVNLEGRLQRQRRAVIAACPDELAWISRLGERFGVEISPYASILFDEVSATCYGGIALRRDRRARRAARRGPSAPPARCRNPPATSRRKARDCGS